MKIKSHKTSVIIWQNFCVEKNINERTLGCGWEVSDFEIRHGFSLINIMLNIIPFDNVRIKDFLQRHKNRNDYWDVNINFYQGKVLI